MHRTADQITLKDSLVRSQFFIVPNSVECFSASFVDSSLINLSVSELQPPYEETTSGVKEPCSISSTWRCNAVVLSLFSRSYCYTV